MPVSGVGGVTTHEWSGGAYEEHLFVSGDCADLFIVVSVVSVQSYLPSMLLGWMDRWICSFPHSLSTYTVLSPRQYE